MSATFNPTAQPLSEPGTASFQLVVQNTGNTEDAYSATIIGANGPISASLVGLDGSPTQSIPIFRLPGLSTGVILVQANLVKGGDGNVTVRINSLNNADITATAVAQLSAPIQGPGNGGNTGGVGTGGGGGGGETGGGGGQTGGGGGGTGETGSGAGDTGGKTGGGGFGTGPGGPIPDGPQVTKLQRFGFHSMPTMLLLHFDQPLDATRARDVKEYKLVGPRGRLDPIVSASYNPTMMTVTLHPKRRVNIHDTYRLTVIGTSPGGLTSSSGQSLDGKGSAEPGTNYFGKIDWRDLVLPDAGSTARGDKSAKTTHRPALARHSGSHCVARFKRISPIPTGTHPAASTLRVRSTRVALPARHLPPP
jgi:hypothetical protein